MFYETIEDAQQALRNAEIDTAADMGEEAVEAAFSDLVGAIAACSTSEVARELYRRELGIDETEPPHPRTSRCGPPKIVEPAGWVCRCGAGPYATAATAAPESV